MRIITISDVSYKIWLKSLDVFQFDRLLNFYTRDSRGSQIVKRCNWYKRLEKLILQLVIRI